MKKESVVAIVFGILLGLMVAFFVIFQSKQQQLSKTKLINNQTKGPTSKVQIAVATPFLEVSFPSDRLVLDTDSIIIKGKANENSLIVIQSPIKELVFKNESTDFGKDFPLALGENVIELTNYPEDKNISSVHKQLRVYYLDTKDTTE